MKRDAKTLTDNEAARLADRKVRKQMEKDDVSERRAAAAAEKSAISLKNVTKMVYEWKEKSLSAISTAIISSPETRKPGTHFWAATLCPPILRFSH